jgi:hypothetical protein
MKNLTVITNSADADEFARDLAEYHARQANGATLADQYTRAFRAVLNGSPVADDIADLVREIQSPQSVPDTAA